MGPSRIVGVRLGPLRHGLAVGPGRLRRLASCCVARSLLCWRGPAGFSRGHPSVGLCGMGFPQSTPAAIAPGRAAAPPGFCLLRGGVRMGAVAAALKRASRLMGIQPMAPAAFPSSGDVVARAQRQVCCARFVRRAAASVRAKFVPGRRTSPARVPPAPPPPPPPRAFSG